MQEILGPASVACPSGAHSASVAAALSPSIPAPNLPAGVVVPDPIVVRSEYCSLSSLACVQLVEQARSSASQLFGDDVVLGFDCEWTASLPSQRKYAVTQLSCVNGYTVIFHVKSRACRASEAGIMPKALKGLMEDDEIQLVSVDLKFMRGRPSSVHSVASTVASCPSFAWTHRGRIRVRVFVLRWKDRSPCLFNGKFIAHICF